MKRRQNTWEKKTFRVASYGCIILLRYVEKMLKLAILARSRWAEKAEAVALVFLTLEENRSNYPENLKQSTFLSRLWVILEN